MLLMDEIGLHTPFFLLSLFVFFFLRPLCSLEYACASPLLVLKKIMTRRHRWRRDREEKGERRKNERPTTDTILCVRVMISSRSFSSLCSYSKDDCRGAHKAHSTHTKLLLLLLMLVLSLFVCIFTLFNIVKTKKKSHFYRSQHCFFCYCMTRFFIASRDSRDCLWIIPEENAKPNRI